MDTLVKKISKPGLLKVKLIGGPIVMALAMIMLPLGIVMTDASLILNPYVLGVVLVGMLLFGLAGVCFFILPYRLYQRLPEVEAEVDEEFLYIHSKKEAKIPLSALADATLYLELPYLLQKEMLYELVIHLFSEKYGDLLLEVPGYGKYRLYYVSDVHKTYDEFIRFMSARLTVIN